jgi:hypothetical protein
MIIYCQKPHKFWFSPNALTQTVSITSGTVSNPEEGDAVLEQTIGSDVSQQRRFTPTIDYSYLSGETQYSFESSNNAVATVNSVGVVEPVAAGTVVVSITATLGGLSKSRDLQFTQTVTPGEISKAVKTGVSGSVRKEISDNIDNSISGKTPFSSKPVFSTSNHAAGTYVYNTSCWGYGFVNLLTAFSPWNSRDAQKRAGVAITPRNFVNAWHFPLEIGDTIRFVEANGTVATRIIMDRERVGSTDVMVYALNSDLPAGIYKAKMFPSNWRNYFTPGPNSNEEGESLPMMCFNQYNKLVVISTGLFLASSYAGTLNLCQYAKPVGASRIAFEETLILGDSGSPIAVKVGSELLLVSSPSSTLGGPAYPALSTALQSSLNTVNTRADVGSHTLGYADFSEFTDFS